MHLLCSVFIASAFILSLLFLFSPSPSLFCLSCLTLSFCISVTRSLLTRKISHSPGLYNSSSYLISVFLLNLLDFGCCFSITATVFLQLLSGCAHCVRNQEQTKVGVWRASALGLRLHVFGISLPLPVFILSSCSPLSLPASCHFALLVRVGMIALVCSSMGANAMLSVCSSI